MRPDARDAEVHIASYVVQHREEAGAALAALAAADAGLELAVAGATRSVVLCECAGRHAVSAYVDRLQQLPGVLNVLLVYHHAESGHALDEPLSVAEASTPA